MNRDHMLGFPPVMLALEDLPDTPKPRPHCPTPARKRVGGLVQAQRRSQDWQENMALTVELERKLRGERAVAAVPAAAPPAAPPGETHRQLMSWFQAAMDPNRSFSWGFSSPLALQKLRLLELMGVERLDVWKGPRSGARVYSCRTHLARGGVEERRSDLLAFNYQVPRDHQRPFAEQELEAMALLAAQHIQQPL
jgi:hypothetical protein